LEALFGGVYTHGVISTEIRNCAEDAIKGRQLAWGKRGKERLSRLLLARREFFTSHVSRHERNMKDLARV